jgi:hypothetical protein
MIKKILDVLKIAAAVFICILVSQYAVADKLSDAHRLLRITEIGEQFDITAKRQTSDILRTYSSIVVMSTDVTLPESLIQQISNCYSTTYTWKNFEPGIAQIFADNLSQLELRLLLDFFSDKSVPPTQIERFKNLRDKAGTIEQLAIDYMFSHSDGCDEQNVDLILAYLAAYNS